jgi:3-hydroxyacyl-CoA dehydrogenase
MMTVGVVGAGAMGSGIAQVALRYGHPVILADVEKAAAMKAKENIEGAFARDVEKGRLTSEVAESARETSQHRVAAAGPWRVCAVRAGGRGDC